MNIIDLKRYAAKKQQHSYKIISLEKTDMQANIDHIEIVSVKGKDLSFVICSTIDAANACAKLLNECGIDALEPIVLNSSVSSAEAIAAGASDFDLEALGLSISVSAEAANATSTELNIESTSTSLAIKDAGVSATDSFSEDAKYSSAEHLALADISIEQTPIDATMKLTADEVSMLLASIITISSSSLAIDESRMKFMTAGDVGLYRPALLEDWDDLSLEAYDSTELRMLNYYEIR